jgi:D-alanyl-D-alanine carboxypeptidase/D-alanyl-D-alanine-endopeptidase (penicillin-binding protein 4)
LRLTRRAALAGLAAALAAPAAARADLRPRPRPQPGAPEALRAILERSGLGALSGFAVAEAASGAVLEAHQADLDRPPASVAKVVTALYALDRLGAGHRFETRLVAAGGDLALVGGGDPLVDTDALGDLLAAARASGLRSAPARFLVDAVALPGCAEIDPGQPAHAGYNPAVSGMNLNFNRVHLAWAPGAAGPELRLSAPGRRYGAEAPCIVAEVGGAGPPRHRIEAGREVWAFAAPSVAGAGSLWLPVRDPAAYSGAVLRALAAQSGLALPPPQAGAAPEGAPALAVRTSQALGPMLRDMLDYSTNLTAEVVGLAAARAGGGAADGLAASGGAMSDWARARFGLARTAFVNHSGLTVRSSTTASEMARLLVAAADAGLPAMLRERGLRDAAGAPSPVAGVRIVAKTGTLDFVSALAGYIEGPGGRRRAFAIFAADLEARARVPPEAREDPPGAAAWARRARAQEQALLRRWIALG